MKIVRGFVRLAIVLFGVTLIGLPIHDLISANNRADEEYEKDHRIWTTLRCGQEFIGKDMSAYTNQYGIIDIGKAGCSNKQFLATFDEIKKALAQDGPSRQQIFAHYYYFPASAMTAAITAVFVFILTLLVGLGVAGIRASAVWIRDGFK